MTDDRDDLEAILANLKAALEMTASAGEPIHREYAGQLLQITSQYSRTLARGPFRGALRWRSDPRPLVRLTSEAASRAQTGQWKEALEGTHLALSVLPGEPGGLPITPPPLPW
jgi:hypothetical protein